MKRLLGHRPRRLAAILDQLMYAAVNFVVTLAVAHQAGVDGLGRFTLPFALLLAAQGIHRAALVDPLMASDLPPQRVTLLTSWLSSLLGGSICLAVSYGMEESYLAVVAVVLVFWLPLDLVRHLLIKTGRSPSACILSATTLASTATAFLIAPSDSGTLALLPWLAGVAVACIIGHIRVRHSWETGRTLGDISNGIIFGSVGDALLYQAAWGVPINAILSILDTAVAGEYRAAVTFASPAYVLIAAVQTLAYGRLLRAPEPRRAACRLAAYSSIVSAAYAAAVVVASRPLSELVFGNPSFIDPLILLLTLSQAPFIAASTLGAVLIKVQRRSSRLFAARITATGALVAGFIAAIIMRSESLAIAALLLGVALQALLVWSFSRSRRRSDKDRARIHTARNTTGV
ncbi:hypothetical protein SAMN04488085_104379 [Geodermatophilus ruber]|uniref:Membrane protein involved in the export of O-antigen and teichoic acid n=1 Tax=Geodermatophilus ruber TaxID=504800 RepID=A0A1I4DFV7_9ACTN|nr:hypothetical protein SAMN04488085_104379 [Geodermatophilus ruber]